MPEPENQQGIFLITGIMAAGKSTIADLLAKRFEKSVHVRGDLFRKMVVKGREGMSAQPAPVAIDQLRLRHKLTAKVADGYFRIRFYGGFARCDLGFILK